MGKLRKTGDLSRPAKSSGAGASGQKGRPAKVTRTVSKRGNARATIDRLVKELWVDPAAWLASPNAHFGGRAPRDLLGTDEEQKVLNLVMAIDQGLY